MTDAALKSMNADEFLVWRLDQEGTWELVDGVPVLKFDNGPEMMAGGTRAHARIASNLIMALGKRLAGGPCYPLGGDLGVRMTRGNLRQPDVTVECGPGNNDDLEATDPKALFEVLSPSTRRTDLVLKTNEYQRLPGLAHFVLLEPGGPEAILWSRLEQGDWIAERVTGLEAEIALPGLGVSLPMAEVYAGVKAAVDLCGA